MGEVRALNGYQSLIDLPCWELTLNNQQVVVSQYGAHVLSYQVDGTDLLWLSPTAVWHPNKPIRGGVPICWPWFGPCPIPLKTTFTESALPQPNHGIVRTQAWSRPEIQASAQQIVVIFRLANLQLPWYAQQCELVYQIELSHKGLRLTLQCDAPMMQQGALHSYFAVEDCENASVSPLPHDYYDKVQDTNITGMQERCEFSAEVDRVYPQTASKLTLTADNLKLALSQSGHDASVIWNPWQARAAAIADIAPQSWRHFVCVETASLGLQEKPLKLCQFIHNPHFSD